MIKAEKIGLGVRNIVAHPLMEEGKTYDIVSETEDPNGTLTPDVTHCWLEWEAKISYTEQISQTERVFWGKQTACFRTLEAQAKAIEVLNKHLIL